MSAAEHSANQAGISGIMHPHGLHRLGHTLWFAPVHAALTRAIGPRPEERVLDVGAGPGLLSERLSQTGAMVVCLEPDAESLKAARQRLSGKKVEFIRAPVEHIPLPDASVDAAVASVTAHHWVDLDAGLSELARVIRPSGRLVMAEFKPAGKLRRRVRQLGGSKHLDALDLAAWVERLQAAGFSDVRRVRPGMASALALFIHATR